MRQKTTSKGPSDRIPGRRSNGRKWAIRRTSSFNCHARPARRKFFRSRVTGIIGFCGLGAEGRVDLLYTDYRFQRQGLARNLYREVETEARRRGARRLFTEASITARPFFESMGFGVIREQRVEFGGICVKNDAMERHLQVA